MRKFKYLNDEETYKEDAFLALGNQFESRNRFEKYYSQIESKNDRNEFLRVSAAYLFFVRNGNWKVDVPRSNELIDYFTNSFKLVALLGIIESLSSEKFEDFYQWLRKHDDFLPISDKTQLDSYYQDYKKDFGAIRKCKQFFVSLPESLQEELKQSINIDGKPLATIERFAEMLYQARSGFAHEVQSTTEFSGNHFGSFQGKRTHWKLRISRLLAAFEIGLLSHFKNQ
jgi:hypothetical protein